MIKEIQLKNFQSHQQSTLEFDPGVNIIVGGSDSGKTAIIRALRWVMWNRPGGDAFRSNWGGDTEVRMTLTDGQTIIRHKSKDNRYVLSDSEFRAFGQDVPDEIQQALFINEINLQSQLDSPFLLSNSAGEVAQHFNKVAHLDVIDRAIRYLNSEATKTKNNITSHTRQIQEVEDKLQAFADLDKMESVLEVLEGMESSRLSQFSAQIRLVKLVDDIGITEKEKAVITPLIALERQVGNILKLQEEKQSIISQQTALQWKVQSIGESERLNEKLQRQIKPESLIIGILQLIADRATLNGDRSTLKETILKLTNMESSKTEASELILHLEEEWHETMPNVCPLCGK